MTNAHAACVRFFGDTPYQIIIQDWDQAYAEYDEAGTLTGFQFSMLAIKAQ
ncbi:hypothetical protein [Micromonospora coerulea]|uniref:hypothetical protein n=1 Tax=Micromonospora coerulea TaxID=47856 RepID=UPI001908046E|nr:hypothetical protein [Micromonospora veneta]